MPSSTAAGVDDYPSMLWVVIPPILLASFYYTRKWYLARKLRLYGIGKGAPGFQTNVRRIRVTPEIAARLRRGEDVSPEEIAAASAKADELERRGVIEETVEPAATRNTARERPLHETSPPEEDASANEWLPDSVKSPKKRAKGKKK